MGLFKFTWWNTIDTLRLLLSKQIRLEMKIGEKNLPCTEDFYEYMYLHVWYSIYKE